MNLIRRSLFWKSGLCISLHKLGGCKGKWSFQRHTRKPQNQRQPHRPQTPQCRPTDHNPTNNQWLYSYGKGRLRFHRGLNCKYQKGGRKCKYITKK